MTRRPGWFAQNFKTCVLLAILSILLSAGGIAIAANGSNDPAPGPRVAAGSSAERDVSAKRTPKKSKREGRRGASPEPPARRLFRVTRVVDGDTLELGNGASVRLVGIDTPEVGECGFEAASDALAGLVLGQLVRLSVSDEDRDQYGRLLRYVNVGTMDAGLRLIKQGLAIARYDSRDGYGYHPREDVYVDVDAATKDIGCPRPARLVGPTTSRCAAGYSPCLPPSPPDIDCADVDGPVRVSGPDPHGLDADGDGWACES